MLTRVRLLFSTQLRTARIISALFPNADPLLIDWQIHTEGGSGLVPVLYMKLPPLIEYILLRPCAKQVQSNV